MSDSTPDYTDPFDEGDWRPAREIFRHLGYEPLPPAALDGFQLPGRLWEFIYAMAGQRLYLDHTDLLSDCDLYTWLHDQWLEDESSGIPPEGEEVDYIDMTDFNNGLDPIIWLRYFASEEERLEFAREHHLDSLPLHEDPAYDRDRWLPVPPGLPPVDDEDDPFPTEEDVEDDPLGLKTVDSEIRAERRRAEQAAITGGEGGQGWQRPMEQLQRAGAAPIPPAELTDETLTAKLWELLHHLACRGFYVLHTDHLSDRELYTALWDSGLRDDALLPGKRSRMGGWFHDFVGSGSEEDTQVWLRFHATDAERAEHAKDWPDDPIPPRAKPPFNRDWRLPKGPF